MNVLLTLRLLDVIINCVIVDGNLLLAVSLYLCLVVALRHRYEAFNGAVTRHVHLDVAVTDGDLMSPREIRRLRQLQAELGVTVRDLDDDFSHAAFVWITLFVLGVCVEVSRFLGGHRDKDAKHEPFVLGKFAACPRCSLKGDTSTKAFFFFRAPSLFQNPEKSRNQTRKIADESGAATSVTYSSHHSEEYDDSLTHCDLGNSPKKTYPVRKQKAQGNNGASFLDLFTGTLKLMRGTSFILSCVIYALAKIDIIGH